MKKKYIDRNIVTCTPALCETTIIRIDEDICGYVSMVNITEVEAKGYICSNGSSLCIADTGYQRLLFLPDNQYWCLTAIYTEQREIIEWYFDITKRNFIDEDGVPCYDDLYLDVVLLPDGQIILLDEDELSSALHDGQISQFEYYNAYKTYKELMDSGIVTRDYLEPLCTRLFHYFGE